jgi:hypothetical protein
MGPIPMGTHVVSVSHYVLLYVVVSHGSHVRDGWDLFQWEPTSRPCLSTFCHMWTFHVVTMRVKDALHSKGEYPRLDVVHAAG